MSQNQSLSFSELKEKLWTQQINQEAWDLTQLLEELTPKKLYNNLTKIKKASRELEAFFYLTRQHFLYFLPLPQIQGSFLPTCLFGFFTSFYNFPSIKTNHLQLFQSLLFHDVSTFVHLLSI